MTLKESDPTSSSEVLYPDTADRIKDIDQALDELEKLIEDLSEVAAAFKVIPAKAMTTSKPAKKPV